MSDSGYSNDVWSQDKGHTCPTVYYAGSQSCSPGHFWKGIRDHCLLHVIEYGNGTFTVAGDTLELTSGDAFLIQPGDLAHYCASGTDPWRYHWVGFIATDQLITEISLPRRSVAFSMEPLVHTFVEEHGRLKSDLDRSELRQFAATGSFYRVLQVVCDAIAPKQNAVGPSGKPNGGIEPASVNRYVRALYWIVQRNYSTPITIEEIARRIGISRKHLSEVVRRETGSTPMQILTARRLQTGSQLLASTDLSIADIARSCGYNDQLLFSRRFKSAFGCSPTEFRREDLSYILSPVSKGQS